jgi:hypothetical protein
MENTMRTLPRHEEAVVYAASDSHLINKIAIIALFVVALSFAALPASADSISTGCRSDNHLVLSGQCSGTEAVDLTSFDSGARTAGMGQNTFRPGDDGDHAAWNGSLWKDDMGSVGNFGDHHDDHEGDHNGDPDGDHDRDDDKPPVRVPEPGNLVLVAIGLSALAVIRKDSWFSGRPS